MKIYFEHELIELIARGLVDLWPGDFEVEGYVHVFVTDHRIVGDCDSMEVGYIERDECRHMYE